MILNRKPTRNSRQHAFTLIEVLFATVAFAIVLAAINTVFYGALRMRERSDERFKSFRPQFQALEIVKQDLRATFYSEDFRADRFWSEPSVGLSVAADQIQFFCTTGTTSELSPWPDVQQIEYYLAPTLDPRKSPQTMDLVRAITRNFLITTVQPPVEQRLASGITGFQLSFFDGEIWQETWDSEIQDPVLPKAVQIYLEFAPTNQLKQLPPSLTQMVAILAEPRLAEPDEGEEGEEEPDEERAEEEGENNAGNQGGGQAGGQGNADGGNGQAQPGGGRN
jgi:type II secretion system protein J